MLPFPYRQSCWKSIFEKLYTTPVYNTLTIPISAKLVPWQWSKVNDGGDGDGMRMMFEILGRVHGNLWAMEYTPERHTKKNSRSRRWRVCCIFIKRILLLRMIHTHCCMCIHSWHIVQQNSWIFCRRDGKYHIAFP